MSRRRAAPVWFAAVVAVTLAACTTSDEAAPTTSPGATAATAGAVGSGTTATPPGDCDDAVLGDDLPDGPLADQPAEGEPLPSVLVQSLDDCTPVDTASWVGEPLVVNFWASWCGPCRAEMPDLAEAAEVYDGRVRFIGVTFMDDPVDSRAFLDEYPVPYDSFVDANGQDLFRAIEARGTPATVLVDADGAVVFRHAGQISADALAEAISDHLDVDA